MRKFLITALLMMTSLPAAAHDMSKLGPKGGQLAHVASNHFELLPLPGGGVRLYIYAATDENVPADATNASAKGRFVVNGKISEAAFSSIGGNAMAAATVPLTGRWTALLQVSLPGKTTTTVRFNTAVMAAQAKATAAAAPTPKAPKAGDHAHH
jgi:hypothetical protein